MLELGNLQCGQPGGMFDSHLGRLCPDWMSGLNSMLVLAEPLLRNGTLSGFFVGDELGLSGVGYHEFVNVTDHLRLRIGPDKLLTTNEGRVFGNNSKLSGHVCPASETGSGRGAIPGCLWPRVPPALDFISVDLYYANGTKEVERVKSYYEAFVFPGMSAHQLAFAVPGTFWDKRFNNKTTTSLRHQAENERRLVQKLQAYVEWAKLEPRLVGLMPWHYNDRCYQHMGTFAPLCGGARTLPKVVAELQRIGASLPQRKVLPSNG